MPKTRTKAEKKHRRLLAAQERSGLSLRAFAAERGLSAGHLAWWRHEIKRRDAERGPTSKAEPGHSAFLPVTVLDTSPAKPAQPESESESASPLGYEVVVAGRVLRLPRDFDPAQVASLVRAVEAVC